MAPTPNSADSSSREWWWVFDPRLSLRAAAGLLTGGASLLLVVLFTWIAAVILRRSLEVQLGSAFETLAAQVTDKIDRTIYERYRTLQLAANLSALRAFDTPAAERRRILETVQEACPEFAWVGLTDATGRVLAGTRGQSEGVAMEQRPWFLFGRERPFVSTPREVADAEREPGSNEEAPRVFELAVPVTGTGGQFAGVLAARVRWNWARDVQLSVVSESARRDLVGATLYGPNKEVLLDSGASGWTHPPDAPAAVDGRRARGTVIEDSAGGTRYLTGFARSRGFREYRGLGWTAVVRQPIDRAFAPIENFKRAIIVWGFLFVLVMSVGSWVIAGRFARRLRSIGTAAHRIREGDVLTVLPQPAGESELARMCTALGELVEHFRAKQPPADKTREREPAQR